MPARASVLFCWQGPGASKCTPGGSLWGPLWLARGDRCAPVNLAGTTGGGTTLLHTATLAPSWAALPAGLEQEVRLPAEHALNVPGLLDSFAPAVSTGTLARSALLPHHIFPRQQARSFVLATDARQHGERGHSGSSSDGRPADRRQRHFCVRCRQAQP